MIDASRVALGVIVPGASFVASRVALAFVRVAALFDFVASKTAFLRASVLTALVAERVATRPAFVASLSGTGLAGVGPGEYDLDDTAA